MRAEIAAHKPGHGQFDIKHGEGGLIDLEFALQALQLRHRVGLHPRIETVLAELESAGLVPSGIDGALRLLTRMLVMFRLVSPSSAAPPVATRPLVAAACGLESWDELLAAHAKARQSISALWRAVAAEAGG
jgi:glutamate-ammonia-ligase adenylyltransferase